MFDPSDELWMRRAIDLAMRGRGAVEPNPMVGCVIVRDGRMIGEGYHQRFGQPHAEPNALAACTESPAGATAYVTLEPCCHIQKKTPPCVPALVAAKLARVVVGCADPNPLVSHKGFEQLRAAGVRVDVGVLEPSARQLIAAFIARWRHHRPYITLKWAQSADGKVAGPAGKRTWISNETSRRLVHELRARCDTILVGIGTVLADDPLLTARDVASARPLIRAVVDTHLRIPMDSQLVRTADQGEVIVFCSAQGYQRESAKRRLLEERRIGVWLVPQNDDGSLSLSPLLRALKNDTTHLLVEGGPTLAGSFLRTNFADRVWIFRSPTAINDPTAPAGPAIDYAPVTTMDVAGDILSEHLNPHSEVYFAGEPSADWVLARGARRGGETGEGALDSSSLA